MRYLLILAYAISVIFIVYHFYGMWALTVALLLALLIPALQKIVIDNDLADDKAKRAEAVASIATRIDLIGEKIEAIRAETTKSVLTSQEARAYASEHRAETARLSRRLLEVEKTLSSMRRIVTTAFGSFDERLQLIEERKEER